MRDADDLMRAHFDHACCRVRRLVARHGKVRGTRPTGLVCRGRAAHRRASSRCLRHGCSTSPAARASSPSICVARWWGSTRALRWSRSPRPACRTREWSRETSPPLPFDDGEFDRVFTSHFFHHLSPDRRAAFLAEARRVGRELVVVEDVRRPDAPTEEWREVDLGDGSHHRMHRHSFTAAELSAELGDGQVLHEGRWFVVVAAS